MVRMYLLRERKYLVLPEYLPYVVLPVRGKEPNETQNTTFEHHLSLSLLLYIRKIDRDNNVLYSTIV